jgi:diguanylate cyclase (GGDEF)-like protein
MKKHALFDFETKLYNRQFLEETYRSLCAKAKRYERTLTIARIQIPELNIDSPVLSKEERKEVLHRFGAQLWKLIRDSDIACHVENENFVLLLPETTIEQSKVIEDRIEEMLEKEYKGRVTFVFKACEAMDEKGCETVLHDCIAE